ncbi:MAG: hypothetical protein U9N83_14350 [Thermodesulfobacteriota bacterium]|nr:hypothetical protein [Thermodesulfobacteriota bacterium]
MRFQKMFLPLWIVVVVLSGVLIMFNTKSMAADSGQEGSFSEITVDKGASAPDFTLES